MPNIDLSGGRSRARKLFNGNQSLNLPKSPAAAFETFIDQGNVFNVRKNTRKIDRFIPDSPQSGLEGSFDADQFAPSSIKTGKRIARFFK